MQSFQHVVSYRRADGTFLPVASIWLPVVSVAAIVAIMTGGEIPAGARIRYFYNPLSLRPMQFGDLVKCVEGTIEYVPVPPPVEEAEERAVIEAKPKRTRKSKKAQQAAYERQRAIELGDGDDAEDERLALLDQYSSVAH